MGYFAIYEDAFFKAGMIFIVIQSILLVVVYNTYNTKKEKSIIELSEIEDHC
jgi:hypothetical protein